MVSSLPLHWKGFFPFLYFVILLVPSRWWHEISGDGFQNVDGASLLLQFCPILRYTFQSRFRTISSLIQVPRMTNVRARICEHNSQLWYNSEHTFLCSLVLPIRCRCTLTWWWSFLWTAQVHTVIQSLFFDFFEKAQRCESWEICPLEFHRFSIDSIQFFEIASFQIPFDLFLPSLNWFSTDASQA